MTSPTPSTRTARCSCGALSLTCSGEPIRVSLCHCLACQRRTGSTYGVQARFDAASVTTAGTPERWTRVGDEGSRIEYQFCRVCGATVAWTLEGRDDVIVPVGAFADPGFPAPSFTVYEARRHAWVSVPEGVESWE